MTATVKDMLSATHTALMAAQDCRSAQREYFADRSQKRLVRAKEAEAALDRALERALPYWKSK